MLFAFAMIYLIYKLKEKNDQTNKECPDHVTMTAFLSGGTPL